MTIKHMRIFLAVYQEMNITKAAKRLHMTQPAVTRAIQELEHYYGIRLFERINHRLYQTKCGDDLYDRALHIVDSFDELEKRIKNWDELGIFRVGASITLGNFFLPGLIKQFQSNHPNLNIQVMISKSKVIQQGILDNQIDVALIEGEISSEHLVTKLFAQDCLKTITPPDHPLLAKQTVLLRELISYPLLLRDKGSAGRIFLDHVFASHGLPFHPLWESASTQALINGTAAGIGISILPEQLVAQAVSEGKVASLILEDEAFIRNNYIVWHQKKYLTKTAQEFISCCF